MFKISFSKIGQTIAIVAVHATQQFPKYINVFQIMTLVALCLLYMYNNKEVANERLRAIEAQLQDIRCKQGNKKRLKEAEAILIAKNAKDLADEQKLQQLVAAAVAAAVQPAVAAAVAAHR